MVHFPSENTHREAETPVLVVVQRDGLRLIDFTLTEMQACGTWDRQTMERVTDNVRPMLAHLLNRTSAWQPIETAPDMEDGVLVVDASRPTPTVGVARCVDGEWVGYDHGYGCEGIWPTPTHWMPLPAPPTTAPSQAQDGYEADAIGEVNQRQSE